MRGGGYEEILAAFLETNRLYVNKSDDRWTVSRIRIEGTGADLWSVDAYDATPAQIISKLSDTTKTTITYQQLPAQRVSLHLAGVTVAEAVETLLRPWEEYRPEQEAGTVHISRRETMQRTTSLPDSREILQITRNGEQYDGHLRNVSVQRAMETLFGLAENQYSSLIDGSSVVGELSFAGRDFQRTLELVMEQVNGNALLWDGIWYLLPGGGSARDAVADRNRLWRSYRLDNTTVASLRSQLETQFAGLELVEIDRHSFLARLDQEGHGQLASFIQGADIPLGSHPIQLKYIKSETLLKNLPPSVEAQDLVDAGTGDTVFFVGPEGRRKAFLQELEILDRPRQLIRYDLLIMQYQKSSSLSWGVTAAMRPLEAGDRTVISGELGRLLGMNFDAITLFGLLFSLRVNAALGSNEASVFADTTLYGNSGEKISFKNTNTYRYREAVVDPDTGKSQYTGITREIVSGLVLDIAGWASGDGMITMDVSASVSKQGVDTNSVNPPPTTEKVVSTQVRARSGEPVVLSGLSQRNEDDAAQGVPFLSRIPLLGNLFRAEERSESHTEMIIYLVPHLEEDGSDSALHGMMEEFYSLCGSQGQGVE